MTGYVNDTAFPIGSEQTQGLCAPSLGISVLEYFAAAALSGILSNSHMAECGVFNDAARLAYKAAEELLRISRPDIPMQQEEQNEAEPI